MAVEAADQLVAETEDLDAVGVENCGFDQVDLRSGTRNPAAFSVRGNHYDVRPERRSLRACAEPRTQLALARCQIPTNSRDLRGPVADVITPAVGSAVAADRQVAELTELSTFDATCSNGRSEAANPTLAPTGLGTHERAMGVGRTTDQLRTTTAELSGRQRSTMDTSERWLTLDNCGGPIWGQGVASSNLASPTNTFQPTRTLHSSRSDVGRGEPLGETSPSPFSVTMNAPETRARVPRTRNNFASRSISTSPPAAVSAPDRAPDRRLPRSHPRTTDGVGGILS